jgi:ATP-dependent exoDNAse (exonuclease V) alpha subunit
MTCHKAQGLTVDVALFYDTGGVTREAGYVGLSRGRLANHLYVAEPDDQEQPYAAGDGLDRVAARLTVRRSQTLATRQLPRRTAGGWRSPTTFDTSLHRTEGIAR